LQSYFMQRIEKWLNGHGRNIIGWDEILQGGISKTATAMSWRGSKGGIAAAKAGNTVIMAPNTHLLSGLSSDAAAGSSSRWDR